MGLSPVPGPLSSGLFQSASDSRKWQGSGYRTRLQKWWNGAEWEKTTSFLLNVLDLVLPPEWALNSISRHLTVGLTLNSGLTQTLSLHASDWLILTPLLLLRSWSNWLLHFSWELFSPPNCSVLFIHNLNNYVCNNYVPDRGDLARGHGPSQPISQGSLLLEFLNEPKSIH